MQQLLSNWTLAAATINTVQVEIIKDNLGGNHKKWQLSLISAINHRTGFSSCSSSQAVWRCLSHSKQQGSAQPGGTKQSRRGKALLFTKVILNLIVNQRHGGSGAACERWRAGRNMCEVGEMWTFCGLETSSSACSRQTFSQGHLIASLLIYLFMRTFTTSPLCIYLFILKPIVHLEVLFSRGYFDNGSYYVWLLLWITYEAEGAEGRIGPTHL